MGYRSRADTSELFALAEMNRKKVYRFFKRLPDRLGRQRIRRLFNNARFLFRKPYIHLDNALAVHEKGVFLSGWYIAPKAHLRSVQLRCKDGTWRDITAELTWQADDDLLKQFGMYKHRTQPRFAALVELPQNSSSAGFVSVLRFKSAAGRLREIKLTVVESRSNPLSAIQHVLTNVPLHHAQKRDWFDSVYGPTINAIWQSRITPENLIERVDYNCDLNPAQPLASLVIPIYGRYDFIEFQLSEFVNDPDMFRYEILYVIDDPNLISEIKAASAVLERVYRIAFSIIYLRQNMGFAGASNIGASHAKSSQLLMMNSDVVPASSGWLQQLLQSLKDNNDNSITGVRLLYEDETIQHNGMQFFSSPFVNELWTNTHPAKGMPANIVNSSERTIECEAVTGACLLISKANFMQLGGFDESYILGDYEDSDLCMKARAQGLKIRLNQQVVLYHLERLSQSLVTKSTWKEQLTYYNCWLHSLRWDQAIRQLKHIQAQ